MTYIEFATSRERDAARFLSGIQFRYMTDETKQFILDGVKRGIVRVRDPHMYGGQSGVVPTGPRSETDPFMDELKNLHDRDVATRPDPILFPIDGLPDGFDIQWGSRIHHDEGTSHIAWWGASEVWRDYAHEADPGDGYYRIVGPAHVVESGVEK